MFPHTHDIGITKGIGFEKEDVFEKGYWDLGKKPRFELVQEFVRDVSVFPKMWVL